MTERPKLSTNFVLQGRAGTTIMKGILGKAMPLIEGWRGQMENGLPGYVQTTFSFLRLKMP
jgi:hypothetical protein